MKAAGVEHCGALRGVGLVVVRSSGELWVQKDLKNKPPTGRRKGDLSTIFETGKPSESHESNVLGALSELVDDTTMHQISDSLFTMDGFRSTPRLRFGNNGSAISYVVAVTVLDNSDFAPVPHALDETTPVGWMSPVELLAHDRVRPLTRQAVGYLHSKGIIEATLVAFNNPDQPRGFVVPPGHNISEFHQQREAIQDMVPGRVYPAAL
jgi:hypothetical protein